jgi:hypothetical protein
VAKVVIAAAMDVTSATALDCATIGGPGVALSAPLKIGEGSGIGNIGGSVILGIGGGSGIGICGSGIGAGKGAGI